jgi:hypothetical protein
MARRMSGALCKSRGERNHDRLIENALAHLVKSSAAPDVAGRHLN